MLHSLSIKVQTVPSLSSMLPFWASKVSQCSFYWRKITKILKAQTEWEEMWTELPSVRRYPLNCKTVCSTLKALQPNDMPLAPAPSPSSCNLCFCLSIWVFTLARVFQHYLFYPLPSKSSILQNPLFTATQRQLCTSLCHACFSALLMFWQFQTALLQHSPHVPPLLLQTAIMCLSA